MTQRDAQMASMRQYLTGDALAAFDRLRDRQKARENGEIVPDDGPPQKPRRRRDIGEALNKKAAAARARAAKVTP